MNPIRSEPKIPLASMDLSVRYPCYSFWEKSPMNGFILEKNLQNSDYLEK